MSKQPRHRPRRSFPNARRVIVECDFDRCVHCEQPLKPRRTWHMKKNVQTMDGPLFVAGKTKECANPECAHSGMHYYASGVLRISLPYSTYGLDVLAFIGWQHEHEHKQLVEIQQALEGRRVLVNKRTVGKLYRQFLALLGGMTKRVEKRLAEAAAACGGLIWGVDALQPEGHGTLLYVLYEVVSETPVAALQADHPTTDELVAWLQPYCELPYAVLATLSDGEETVIAALKSCWSDALHQRCQEHALANMAEPAMAVDSQLRQRLREDVGGLSAVPTQSTSEVKSLQDGQVVSAPPFCPPRPTSEMAS